MIRRTAIAALLAAGVTFGLFGLMQALVAGDGRPLRPESDASPVEFVRLQKERDTEIAKRRLPERRAPEPAPAPPELRMAAAAPPVAGDLGAVALDLEVDVDLGGLDLSAAVADREAVPIVRVAPQYPERAARRGIEGWVLVGFTITETGGVRDATVLASQPGSIFDREALRAVRRFKFRPKLEDGVAVAQPEQRISIRFELGDG